VVNDLDYVVTLTKLRILDALAGPLPKTSADRRREQDQERIDRAFPKKSRERQGRGSLHHHRQPEDQFCECA
jgi:hypothetical protein